MANTYRKRNGGTAWHFCSNCSDWPTKDYTVRSDKPSHENMCNECRSKKVNDNCK
jgi:hypothetical protein